MKKYLSNNAFYLVSICFLLILASSCKIKKPVFTKINNLKINHIAKDSVHLTLDAVYYNPSIFKASMKALNVKASVNDIPIYTIKEPIEFKINRTDFFSIPIIIAFDPSKSGQKAVTVITSLLFDKQIKMNFQGTIEGKTLIKKFNVPFNFENSYNLESILRKKSEEE